MSKESALEPYIKAAMHKWRARSVPGRILNTFDELGFITRSGLTPVLIKRNKTSYGWYMIFHLPPSISLKKIESELICFEEQSGGTIDLGYHGKNGNIYMDIYTQEFEHDIPYSFEPKSKGPKYVGLPIGYGLKDSLIEVNLPDIPHVLVAGNTRAGKSNTLHSISVSMLKQDVRLCVIDLAKSEFTYLKNHALVATEEDRARELLDRLILEANKRFKKLEAVDCFKWQEYPGDDIPYVCLIIDELAHLEDKESQHSLRKLAQICAGAGMSIILATQRPSATTFKNFTDIRALFPGVICFSVKDRVNSQIVLDNDNATKIPKNAKGRAIWQWDDEVMVQTMHLPSKTARELVKGLNSQKGVIFDGWNDNATKRLPPR